MLGKKWIFVITTLVLGLSGTIAVIGSQLKPEVSKETTQQETKKTEETKPKEETGKVAGESATKYNDLVAVIRVIDGDTIEVADLGKIRLIGIDTPEIVDPRKPVQCFGKEASQKANEMLSGKKVHLESDLTQGNRDKYNRALRYVFLADGTHFNKWMVENGYAHEYTYNLPYKYQLEFKNAERSARENNRGLWSPTACGEQAASQLTDQCLIKGNISSNPSKEKIYHIPGGDYYDKTVIDESKGERWFCSEAEAQAAGWRKSKK